jgi:hypothetical protein
VEIEDETMREQILNLLAGIDITNLTQLRTAEEYINTLDKEVGKSVE